MASRGFGAFAGGLAEGYESGTKLRLAQEDQAQRKQLFDIQREEAQRRLDAEKGADATWQQLADIITPRQTAAPGLAPVPGAMPEDGNLTGDAAPGLQPQGPQTPQERVGFGLYQNPKGFFGDPQKLQQAAELFMRSKSPELRTQGVAWLQAGYKAQKENLIDAVRYAAGGDLQSAEQAFNATGDHKVQPGSLKWADETKTTLTGVDQAGKPFEVKPQEMMKAFLSPAEFFKLHQDARTQNLEERKVKLLEESKGADAELKRAQTETQTAIAEYYRGAKTALTMAQANKANGAAGGALTDKQVNDIIGKGGLALRKMLESEQPKEDAKYNVNGMMALLPDMQAELGQAIRKGTDPEVALQQTYNTIHDRVGALNDALTKIAADANSKWTSSGKDEAMRAGLQTLMGQYSVTPADIRKYLPATKLAKGDAERIRSVMGSISAGTVGAAAPTTGGKDYSKLWK